MVFKSGPYIFFFLKLHFLNFNYFFMNFLFIQIFLDDCDNSRYPITTCRSMASFLPL